MRVHGKRNLMKFLNTAQISLIIKSKVGKKSACGEEVIYDIAEGFTVQ